MEVKSLLFLISVFIVVEGHGHWVRDTDIQGGIFSPRSGHTAVLFQDDLVVIYGGHVLNGFHSPVSYFSNEIWTFTRSTNSMSLTTITTEVPSNRTFHGAVVKSDHEMLMWGGGKVVGFSFVPATGLWVFDLDTHLWSQLVTTTPVEPSGRLAHTMVRHRDKVFVFGGVNPKPDGSCCTFLNDMWEYSLTLNQWTQIFPLNVPTPRAHAGAFVYGSSLWLQGGEGTHFSIEHGLWKYSFLLNDWTLVNDGNPDVNQRESQLFNHIAGKFICFSGDSEGPNFYNLKNDTQTYRILRNQWILQDTPVLPPLGKRMPSVSFGDEVWFFGGNTDLNPHTFIEQNHNEVWFWTNEDN